jgi:hypothetical protein
LRAQEKAKAREAKAAKHPRKAGVDPLAAWNKGQNWLVIRAGLAKSAEPGAASAGGGGALGIQHFLNSRWSLGLVGQGDLLGKFASAAESEYSATLELTRHFRWRSSVRPYFGAGGGAYRHEYYRTGDDSVTWTSGGFLSGGANAPLGPHSILGFDGRMAFVSGEPDHQNPVFGPEGSQLTHYSLKLGWSLVF